MPRYYSSPDIPQNLFIVWWRVRLEVSPPQHYGFLLCSRPRHRACSAPGRQLSEPWIREMLWGPAPQNITVAAVPEVLDGYGVACETPGAPVCNCHISISAWCLVACRVPDFKRHFWGTS